MTQHWPKWLYQPDGKGQVFDTEADVPEGEGWIEWEALQDMEAPSEPALDKPRRGRPPKAAEPAPEPEPEPEPVADAAPAAEPEVPAAEAPIEPEAPSEPALEG